MFRGVKTTPSGSVTRLYVETGEAIAGRVIAENGKSLSSEGRQAEQERLERFLKHPTELSKKRAREREDAERTMHIVRALPEAFVYEFAGEERGSEEIGRAGHPLVKLNFRPNPQYQPPSRVEEVLAGMEGYLLVDAVAFRLASIDGTLFKEVGFGWGILGHLDRGGHFLVHQAEVGHDLWEISRMTVSFTGKIMLLKSLSIQSTEFFSDFKQVPPGLTFAQGVELLEKEDSARAENVPAGNLVQ